MDAWRRFGLPGAIGVLGLIIAGCASPGAVSGKPSWWDDPRPHDKAHLYFKAKGESSVSEQAARDAAMASVKRLLADFILTENDPDGSMDEGVRRFDLREVESYKENTRKTATGRWIVYMMGRYPRSEYRKIQARIAVAERLQQAWAAAQSALNRGELTRAESLLQKIIALYDQALAPGFAVEEAKLKLAGLYLEQTPPAVLQARKWIQDVRKSTGDSGWRRQAEEMERNLPAITLYGAFQGRKVGLFCCIRDGQPVRDSPEVLAEATARLTAAGVPPVRLAPADVALAAGLFDAGSNALLMSTAKAKGVDVVLAILLDIDPAKTGKIEKYFDFENEMKDATVFYQVIRVGNGQVIAADKTPGWSKFGVTSLLNPIFTGKNHLPKHAPVIAEQMSGGETDGPATGE